METNNTHIKSIEDLEDALRHGDPEVRANAALNSLCPPTRAMIERGLKDKSQKVRQAFLNREDITFDCYQLLMVVRNGDFDQNMNSVNTLEQLNKFKNRRFRSGKPMNLKPQVKYVFNSLLKFEEKEITTEETV
jgi:hypothetical protein